jgi:hypothetical protein
MHLPKEAVAIKMKAEGLDVSVLDMDPNSPSPNQPLGAPTVSPAAPAELLILKDDPKFAKYFRMLAMHLPKEAVAIKMQAEGLDTSLLDLDPNSPSPNQSGGPTLTMTLVAVLLLKDDPKYAKYFRMLGMHLPKEAVAIKMQADGLDPAILEMDPNSPTPSMGSSVGNAATASESIISLRDDPKFAKYFKMLAMHLPKEAVAAKMKAEGVDPSVLDLDPDQATISRGPPKRIGGGFALPPPPNKWK